MKDAFYFPHDSNAKDDPKIVLLIEQLGLEGYGIYWVLIETLRDQPNYRYPLKLLSAIARRYVTTSEKVETVVRGYNLFEIENGEFFLSPSLCRRMEIVDSKRKRLSDAGKRGRAKQLQEVTGQAQATPRHPPGSKIKKRKEEKSINIKSDTDLHRYTFDPMAIKPEDVDDDLWKDFISNRKYKNLQNTERALKTSLKQFQEGLGQYSMTEMLEMYISTNWQRFSPEWMKPGSKHHNTSSTLPSYMQGVK